MLASQHDSEQCHCLGSLTSDDWCQLKLDKSEGMQVGAGMAAFVSANQYMNCHQMCLVLGSLLHHASIIKANLYQPQTFRAEQR